MCTKRSSFPYRYSGSCEAFAKMKNILLLFLNSTTKFAVAMQKYEKTKIDFQFYFSEKVFLFFAK